MKETPVVKVGSYRGHKIYVRKIGNETFEYLVWFDNQLWCNQIEVAKKVGQRMRKYDDEELKGAIALLLHTAELWLDDALFAKEIENSLKERVKRARARVENLVFHWYYQITNQKNK